MVLKDTKLKHWTAFVRMVPSETYLRSCGLSDQSTLHLPNCYPVAAVHAQGTQAIVLRIEEHLIPSRLIGQSGSLHHFLSFLTLWAAEHERPLSGSVSRVKKLVYLQKARADQALPAAKLIDLSVILYESDTSLEDHLQSARLNRAS